VVLGSGNEHLLNKAGPGTTNTENDLGNDNTEHTLEDEFIEEWEDIPEGNVDETLIIQEGIMIRRIGTAKHTQGLGFVNINGLQQDIEDKLPWIRFIMNKLKIGALACIDTRLTERGKEFISRLWEDEHPGGGIVFSPNREECRIGGQCLFMNENFKKLHIKTWNDPSNLGLIMENTFRGRLGKIRIVQTYFPNIRESGDPTEGQLVWHVERYLRSINDRRSVVEFMLKGIQQRTEKNAWAKFVLGDINAKPNSARCLAIDDMGLHNATLQFTELVTRTGGIRNGVPIVSHIDHLWTNMESQSIGILQGSLMSEFSDHFPIFVHTTQLLDEDINRNYVSIKKPIRLNTKLDSELINKVAERILSQSCSSEIALRDFSYSIPKFFSKQRLAKRREYWTPMTHARRLWMNWLQKIIWNNNPLLVASRRTQLECRIRSLPSGNVIWEELLEEENSKQMSNWYLDHSALSVAASSEHERIKRLLHARRRLDAKKNLNEALLRIRTNQRRLYKYYNPKSDGPINCIVYKGETIHEEEAVHNILSDNFADSSKNDIPQIKYGLWASSQTLSGFRHAFALEGMKIPSEYEEIFHQELLNVPKRKELVKDLSSLQEGPSLEEFTGLICKLRNGKSAGPSGLKYEILKQLSQDNIKLLHSHLKTIWKSGRFPEWMNAKILCPIPKNAVRPLTLDSVRPVVLIEILRKVWLKGIVQHIRNTLEKHKCLDRRQYGFRQDRSTEQAIVQLINVLEHSQFENRNYFVSSWDISRAFDSVLRPFAELVLERVGVPSNIARMIATMDEHDRITVSTPWAKRNPNAKCFSSGKGCGQGDVQSTLVWCLLMDILIRCVHSHVKDDIIFPLPNGSYGKIRDTNYADDLLSFARTLEALQDKANIYSAVCSIVRLKLAAKKFRCCQLGPKRAKNLSITIFDDQWNPTRVACKYDGAIRYLGSTQDLNLSSKTEKGLISDIISSTVNRLSRRAHLADAQVTYINGALLPKIVYKGSFSLMTLNELRKMDGSINNHIRSELHLHNGYSNDILFSSIEAGGLGMKRFSDTTNLRKQLIMFRALRGPKPVREAMNGILYRNYLINPKKNGNIIQLQTVPNRSWLNSLVSYLAEIDGAAISVWQEFEERKFRPYDTEIEIKYGQVWFTPMQKFIQIKGWTAKKIWYESLHMKDKQTYIRPVNGRTLIASGLLQSMPWPNDNDPYFMFLQCDCHMRIEKVIVDRLVCIPKRTEITKLCSLHHNLLSSIGLLVCTDGSWRSNDSSMFATNNNICTGAAAVVLNEDKEVICRFAVNGALRDFGQRAFAQEYLALTLAAIICQENGIRRVFTDANSVLESVTNSHVANPFLFFRKIILNTEGKFSFVKAHSDDYLTVEEMSSSQYGNTIADVVANGTCKEPTIMLDIHQVFHRLIQCSGWSILMNGNIPLLDDIYQRKSSVTIDSYCTDRKRRYEVNYDYDPAALRILGSLKMSHLQRAAKLKLLFSQYYDDRCFLERRYAEVTRCECGCINMVSSWISNCQRQEIVSTRHQLMAEIDRICFPYEFLSSQIRKLLCENSQEGLLTEQFWRGNWQPGHTATIICSIKSYKMRNGNLSFSTWLRCASRIIKKCYVAMTNCLLDMRCLSPKRVACSTDRFIQGGYMPCSSCTP
jgi:hypothetical protein